VDTAQPDKDPYELRDAAIPGFSLKVTPTGRKVFMVAYVANNGQRRKPAIGRFGEQQGARPLRQLVKFHLETRASVCQL
jgi:hypothetical protein